MRISSLALIAFLPLLVAWRTPGSAPSDDLVLERGTTIALVGNALAERMQHDGWFETELQTRFPGAELVVRNLGFGGDALSVHQRTEGFGKFSSDDMNAALPHERFVPWDRYLDHVRADVVLAFFGFNESFADLQDAEQLAGFRNDLETFVEHVGAKRTLVLCGPIPQEDLVGAGLPDAAQRNVSLARINSAMAAVADSRDVRFVDLFTPMGARYAQSDAALTINGVHLNSLGNRALAEELNKALFGAMANTSAEVRSRTESVRALVREKNGLWFERYRVTDGYNVYGGRSRLTYRSSRSDRSYSNFEVLQRELDHLDVLVANRDAAIHAAVRGEVVEVDDSNAPELINVETNLVGEGVGGVHEFLPPNSAAPTITPASGMEVALWADEQRFPELVNPVQMSWDTRGRLWVAVWPSYPHRRPDQPMNDKLLVLEDTDGDGRADRCEAFAAQLHNPTGFEFWNGGVVVAQAPDLVFLKDTDGDGRADRREVLLHGLSSADTHHAANSFVLGPDGAFYFQEGTFHRSQVESPHGPVRNVDGCVWRFDPRSWRVERYVAYNFANPHGHVFDRWGQDFVTDGTGNVNYYALPFSGHLDGKAKHHGYFPFFQQRSRPAGGTEILSSRHFPDDAQGNYLIANVIGFRGIFRYRVEDDGSGFKAAELEPIVESSDRNFRPVDIETGPDGALYFVDWHNPLIGHMQHHLRDPSRDNDHGRIYRVTATGRPLLQPQEIAGRPLGELLALLEEPEDRVRYRARIELSGHDSDAVLEAASEWIAGLDDADPDYEHHLLEGLWLSQQHGRVDVPLLERLLDARDPRARAAATRVVRHARPARAMDYLGKSVLDAHPRVRLEAVVAASSFPTVRAAEIALDALRRPTDRFLDYAIGETLRGLEAHWRAAIANGQLPASGNEAGLVYLLERLGADELGLLPRLPLVLRALIARHGVGNEVRLAALTDLARSSGRSILDELTDSMTAVDAGDDAHATHLLSEMGSLLLAQLDAGAEAPATFTALTSGRHAVARAIGHAARVTLDGSPERSYAEALASGTLDAWVSAVRFVGSDALRAAMAERIHPLMFGAPPKLRDSDSPGGAGSGLALSLFVPAPADARLATLERLAVRNTVDVSELSLDLPLLKDLSAFGLLFRGTLFAPTEGRYHFETLSDDGSRLYVDGVCVVDNDGAHGPASAQGEIHLAAGAHDFAVTYFEAGGGEALLVQWQVPGGELEPIPIGAMGRARPVGLQAAATLAMAGVERPGVEVLADASRLLSDPAMFEPALELVRAVPASQRATQSARPILDAIISRLAGLPSTERTSPQASAALALGRELAASLPSSEAQAVLVQLDELGGRVLVVRTVPHAMLYDVTEFWVAAGQPVAIVFQNNDVMPHNLVVTAPGALERVGRQAERLPNGEAVDFVPSTDDVLWHTGLLLPGESVRLSFEAPSDPGDYPYLCTYPGHWRVMNGVMRVTADATEAERSATRREVDVSAPVRQFVRDWTHEEFKDSFGGGWRETRNAAAGRELFDQLGCIRCHTIDAASQVGGPDLGKVRGKYGDLELLSHVIEPSRAVLPEYVFYGFELDDGSSLVGRILEEDDKEIAIVEVLLRPEEVTYIDPAAVVERRDTGLSPMPSGLLVTLEAEEVLDLVHFLQGEEAQ